MKSIDLENCESNLNNKTLYQKKIKKNYKNININIYKHIDNSIDKNNDDKKKVYLRDIIKNNRNKKADLKDFNNNSSFSELKEIKVITAKMANEIEKKIENINKNTNLLKTKSTPKFNHCTKYINKSVNQENFIINKENDNKEIKDKIEKQKSKLVKEPNNELSNIITNILSKDEKKSLEQRSFMEDYILPKDIKKECLKELNKDKDKNKKDKKPKENIPINIGNSSLNKNSKIILYKTNENKSKQKTKKEKTEKILKMDKNKENKNYNIYNQKAYYNEFLYGSEKGNINYLNENVFNENNSKIVPYYKEIFGEKIKNKDF